MTTLSVGNDDMTTLARFRKTYKFEGNDEGHQDMQMSPADLNFAGFKFQKSTYNNQKPKTGLTDATNVSTAFSSNHGYINKIRRESVSGKPKEPKKVTLVAHHGNKVSFKPTGLGGRKPSCIKEKKPFSVPTPSHTIHVDEVSTPMDIDAPLLRIRNLMTRVPHGVTDIDAINDPLKSTTYAQDICDYLQAVERRWTFPENFFTESKEVTPHMRTVLMDWLIQVQVHQDLSQHTLHLSVSLIDRFLCKQLVQLTVLQLVGITSLLIAAKYHERFPPEISDLCHLTDNTYTQAQVLKMERMILRKLDFDLNIPSPAIFVDRFLLVNQCDTDLLIQSMSMFLIDLTLTEVTFVHYVPSLLAASAIYVSRGLLGCEVLWDKAYAYYTKYSESDLWQCSRSLRKVLAKMNKSKFTGAHGKYSHTNFHGISNHSSLKHISLHPTELWADEAEAEPQPLDTLINFND